VWTRRDRFAGGQHAEGGAEFVNADHAEVLALAERFGVATEPARPTGGSSMLDAGGRIAPIHLWDSAGRGRLTTDLERWHTALDALADGVDPDDPTSGERARALDWRNTAEFVAELELSALAKVVVGRHLRTEYMVPPEELSLLHVAWMAARERRCRAVAADGWEAFRLVGGNDRIAAGLAASLADRLQLDTAAQAVLATPTGVVVTTGAGAEHHADAVVLAVPLPVLGRIALDPPLPDEVFAVGYGQGAKISTQLARRVWRDLDRNGSVVSDRAHGELWARRRRHHHGPAVVARRHGVLRPPRCRSTHRQRARAGLPRSGRAGRTPEPHRLVQRPLGARHLRRLRPRPAHPDVAPAAAAARAHGARRRAHRRLRRVHGGRRALGSPRRGTGGARRRRRRLSGRSPRARLKVRRGW
jgi:monoamine oxidase